MKNAAAQYDPVEEHVAAISAEVRAPKKVKETPQIRARRAKWIDPKDIQAQQFLYSRDYCRGILSLTIAPGGIGKSILSMSEVVSMATGRNLAGPPMRSFQPLRVWYWNLEESELGLQRKLAALGLRYEFNDTDRHNVEENLYLNNYSDELRTALEGLEDTINEDVFRALESELLEQEIDVLVIDPFVSSHGVSENDNVKIDRIAKRWSRIAMDQNISVSIVHHTRKSPSTGTSTHNAESARGAKALTDAARIVRVLNAMTEKEAINADIPKIEREEYFSIVRDKDNLSGGGHKKEWRKKVGINLENYDGDGNSDNVGIVEWWDWPASAQQITEDDISNIQDLLRGKDYPADVRNSNWAGYTVGQYLGWNTSDTETKRRLQHILGDMEAKKILSRTQNHSRQKGRSVPVYTVPDAAF